MPPPPPPCGQKDKSITGSRTHDPEKHILHRHHATGMPAMWACGCIHTAPGTPGDEGAVGGGPHVEVNSGLMLARPHSLTPRLQITKKERRV